MYRLRSVAFTFGLSIWLTLALSTAATATSDRLASAIAGQRFVSYVPREFSIKYGVPQTATAAGIRADLHALRPYFSGIITYGLEHGQALIPELAVAAGYHALILGVWDPTNRAELDQAIALARRYPRQVVALVLGNEGLFWKRYQASDLSAAAEYVRRQLPGIPLGSSEPFSVYLDSLDAETLLQLDLLLPNVHPRFEPWFDPDRIAQAVSFVTEVLARLQTLTDKPILIKETGLPSAPAQQGFSEQRQADFWRQLLTRIPPAPSRGVAAFEAFDAPWKPRELEDEFGRLEASEAHWGLWRQDGREKPVVQSFGHWPGEPLPVPPRNLD
jgi:exo-beta-1,3-glucanase (GH17 family)